MATVWIFQLKSRKLVDQPDRKSNLEFLHFKAVCFQRPHSDPFRTRSFLSRAQDKCVYVPVGGLKVFQSSRLVFFYPFFVSCCSKIEPSCGPSVAGPAAGTSAGVTAQFKDREELFRKGGWATGGGGGAGGVFHPPKQKPDCCSV